MFLICVIVLLILPGFCINTFKSHCLHSCRVIPHRYSADLMTLLKNDANITPFTRVSSYSGTGFGQAAVFSLSNGLRNFFFSAQLKEFLLLPYKVCLNSDFTASFGFVQCTDSFFPDNNFLHC